MKNNKIKAAIIVDNGPVPFLISDLIDKSLKQDKYEIVALLVQKKINTKKNIISKILNYISRRGLKKFIESSTFALIKILEKFIVKKYYNLDIIFETRNLDSFPCKKIDVHPKISKSGYLPSVTISGSKSKENTEKFRENFGENFRNVKNSRKKFPRKISRKFRVFFF